MLQGVLLEPGIVRRHALPRVDDPGPEAAAWRALVEQCSAATGEPTTASVIQHFAGTEHAGVLAEVLAVAADTELSPEQAETQVLAAAERLRRLEERRALSTLLAQPLEQLTGEEREALARGLKAAGEDERGVDAPHTDNGIPPSRPRDAII